MSHRVQPAPGSAHVRPRLLVFIVAYNAESAIDTVLSRIPRSLGDEYDVEVLVIDDASRDRTFETGHRVMRAGTLAFPLRVLVNPINQGYGGNQKIGYHYAIRHDFDFVALLHGDGQYAPECLPELIRPLSNGEADAVFGSRMLERGAAIRGGMPLYKFVGNKLLTWFQNRILGSTLSEFHSGYRIYAVPSLQRIPFPLNTNQFHFDTEIIIQLLLAGQRIKELPIPTHYGGEVCHVNGLRYAWDVAKAVIVARAQRLGLFYDGRFDCSPATDGRRSSKLDYASPQSLAFAAVPAGARVLELGGIEEGLGKPLRARKGCFVTAVDRVPPEPGIEVDRYVFHDLNEGIPPDAVDGSDFVLLLDVIEHLRSPEKFVQELGDALKLAPRTRLVASTANVGFFVNRLMLILGHFNYGRRGILDLGHTRLFTFRSFQRLFEQGGFRVLESRGVPGPFPLALGDNALSRALLRVNEWLLNLSKQVFAYQIFFVVEPLPSLEYLLREAQSQSALRAAALDEPAGAMVEGSESVDGVVGEARRDCYVGHDGGPRSA